MSLFFITHQRCVRASIWSLFRFFLEVGSFFCTSPVKFWNCWRLVETLTLSRSNSFRLQELRFWGTCIALVTEILWFNCIVKPSEISGLFSTQIYFSESSCVFDHILVCFHIFKIPEYQMYSSTRHYCDVYLILINRWVLDFFQRSPQRQYF